MFEAIKDVFPTRPLKINYTGTSNWGIIIILLILGILSLFSSMFFLSPGILNDYKVSQSVQQPVRGSISDGFSCERQFGVLVSCYGNYKIQRDGQTHGRFHVDMWLDFSGDTSYTNLALMVEGQPETVTLQFVVGKIWERIFFLIGVVLIALWMLWSAWRLIRQAKRGRKMLEQDYVLLPVKVTLSGNTKRRGASLYVVTFQHPETGKYGKANLRMRAGESAFMLNTKLKKALGVIAQGGEVPILLDDKLLRVDFTDAERARIFAAIEPREPNVPS